jgi:ABC-2 type transport system ATP-binding protein
MISVESRIGELIDLLDLSDRADEPVAGYSKGMKQRLALARALMNQPPLLYLDEPTSGLDPEAAQQVNGLISGLSRKDGRTILLCTHNLVEAQRLSDRVAVLNRGKLLALGTIEDLNQKLFPGIKVEIELVDELEVDIRSSTESLRGVKKLNINGKIMSLELEHREVIPTLVEHLVRYKARVMSVNQITYSLEEIYFQIQQNHQGVGL